MITETICPSEVSGTLQAPASKSAVQRLIAVALLANGTSRLLNYSSCDDAEAAIAIARTLGAQVEVAENELTIIAQGIPAKRARQLSINCGESGLSARLFTPLSLFFAEEIQVTGEGSLLKRPLGQLMRSVFEQLNILFSDQEGLLPLELKGAFLPANVVVDGSGGSQFLTGLLMSLPLLSEPSTITVNDLKSKPYIDLTLSILKDSGVYIEHHNYKSFTIKGHQSYKAQDYSLEGDWSGASCILVAGAIAGQVRVSNLDPNSTQGDKMIMKALHDCGAQVDYQEGCVIVSKKDLKHFSFDATDCPDLFPALVALAANCDGVSTITGVSRLISKESNRALSLQTEFAKLGIKIDIQLDDMHIVGSQACGGKVWGHNDHRIAMCLATAALTATGSVVIEGAECVNKSYPDFWKHLYQLSIVN